MTALISQTAVKPVLYTMAIANVVLLTVCACLAFVHTDVPAYVPSVDVAKTLSSSSDDMDAPDIANFQQSTQQSPGVPIAVTRVMPVNHATGASAPSGASPAVTDREPQISSFQATHADDVTRQTAQGGSAQPAPITAGGEQSSISTISGAVSDPTPTISLPLADTTPSNGATAREAAVLNRLQGDFADTMNGQTADPTSPAYAQAWQGAQEQSDWNFKQQFGTEAFIEAQLAQAHGAAPVATGGQ